METGGFPALRQSRRLSVRAECPGQEEAGPTQLLFHAFSAGKVRKTRLPSRVAVSPRMLVVPGVSVSGRPLERLPPVTEVLPRCAVGTVRRDEKHSVNGPELVSVPLLSWSGLLPTPARFPAIFSLPSILWNNRHFGNAWKNKVQPR